MDPITSREYKVMLDHRAFADRDNAVRSFWSEVVDFARPFKLGDGLATSTLAETKQRAIVFLDTADLTLNDNSFILRRRVKTGAGKAEYTLKCRSDDRYVAASANVLQGEGTDPDPKFEEDIAAPFRSRYSRSNSIKVPVDRPIPQTLSDAAKLFPVLATLQRDGLACPSNSKLSFVNEVEALERVYEGPKLDFGSKKASVALILWSRGTDGRPLVAEFSFRYEDTSEEFPGDVAAAAQKFFLHFQRLDWCRPTAMTKTEYVYRTTAAD
jgi:hypothetical protein